MTRPATSGFQKPLRGGKTHVVGLAAVRDDPAGMSECSCGWTKVHRRKKVREDAIEAHLTKKHNGRGVWL